MDFLNTPFEIKTLGDTGSFEGYAGIFGNVDLGGDILERTAIKEVVKGANGMVKVLNQHNMRDPIGGAKITPDDKGIAFEGKLVLEAPSARAAYALMKAGVLDGMSFGYDVLAGGADILKSGIRQLKAIKLWEISPVTFGMNPLAGITGVKGQITTITEFEDFLREAGGYSRSAAKALAGGGFKALQRVRDVPGSDEAKELADFLAEIRTAGL